MLLLPHSTQPHRGGKRCAGSQVLQQTHAGGLVRHENVHDDHALEDDIGVGKPQGAIEVLGGHERAHKGPTEPVVFMRGPEEEESEGGPQDRLERETAWSSAPEGAPVVSEHPRLDGHAQAVDF